MEVLKMKGVILNELSDNMVDINFNLEEDELNDIIRIHVIYKHQQFYSESDNIFHAFQTLRDELLEKAHLGIQSYGSMINVYPSPMMRNTRSAYLLKIGEQAKFSQIVDIFDFVDVSEFATTKKQNSFYDKWVKSL